MNQALLTVAVGQAPALIGLVRDAFARQHPDQPAPSDAEVIAAAQEAFQSSLDRDDKWLATHQDEEDGA